MSANTSSKSTPGFKWIVEVSWQTEQWDVVASCPDGGI
jgi:hypothetical protein